MVAPANDDFASAEELSFAGLRRRIRSTTGTTVDATTETDEDVDAVFGGAAWENTVWYTFQVDAGTTGVTRFNLVPDAADDGTMRVSAKLYRQELGFDGTEAWAQEAAMPVPTGPASIGEMNGIIYSVGGVTPPGGGTIDTRVRAYNTSSDTWAPCADLPVGVFDQVVAGYSGTDAVYSVGGVDATFSRTAVVRKYTAFDDTWSVRASLPTARSAMCGAFIGPLLYVAGGTDDVTGHLTDLLCYEDFFDTWTAKASMPTALSGAGCAVLDGKLYVVGGTHLYIYDPATNTWATGANPPGSADLIGGVGAAQGVVVAFYAAAGTPTTWLTSIYDPSTDSWSAGTPIPHQPHNQAGASSPSVDGYIYVVGGTAGGYNQRYLPPRPPVAGLKPVDRGRNAGGVVMHLNCEGYHQGRSADNYWEFAVAGDERYYVQVATTNQFGVRLDGGFTVEWYYDPWDPPRFITGDKIPSPCRGVPLETYGFEIRYFSPEANGWPQRFLPGSSDHVNLPDLPVDGHAFYVERVADSLNLHIQRIIVGWTEEFGPFYYGCLEPGGKVRTWTIDNEDPDGDGTGDGVGGLYMPIVFYDNPASFTGGDSPNRATTIRTIPSGSRTEVETTWGEALGLSPFGSVEMAWGGTGRPNSIFVWNNTSDRITPAWRASTTGFAGVAIVPPAEAQPGDVVIAACSGYGTTWAPPDDSWLEEGPHVTATGVLTMFVKRVSQADLAGTWTFTRTGGSAGYDVVAIDAFSGVAYVAGVDFSEYTAGGPIPFPALAGIDYGMFYGAYAWGINDPSSPGMNSPMTEGAVATNGNHVWAMTGWVPVSAGDDASAFSGSLGTSAAYVIAGGLILEGLGSRYVVELDLAGTIIAIYPTPDPLIWSSLDGTDLLGMRIGGFGADLRAYNIATDEPRTVVAGVGGDMVGLRPNGEAVINSGPGVKLVDTASATVRTVALPPSPSEMPPLWSRGWNLLGVTGDGQHLFISTFYPLTYHPISTSGGSRDFVTDVWWVDLDTGAYERKFIMAEPFHDTFGVYDKVFEATATPAGVRLYKQSDVAR